MDTVELSHFLQLVQGNMIILDRISLVEVYSSKEITVTLSETDSILNKRGKTAVQKNSPMYPVLHV